VQSVARLKKIIGNKRWKIAPYLVRSLTDHEPMYQVHAADSYAAIGHSQLFRISHALDGKARRRLGADAVATLNSGGKDSF
jgi:hypothetical protein